MNVYSVRLADYVEVIQDSEGARVKKTCHLYVIANSFQTAEVAVQERFPKAEIKGMDLMNYAGSPVVLASELNNT